MLGMDAGPAALPPDALCLHTPVGPPMYHECQRWARCALHTINNLAQAPVVSLSELEVLANELQAAASIQRHRWGPPMLTLAHRGQRCVGVSATAWPSGLARLPTREGHAASRPTRLQLLPSVQDTSARQFLRPGFGAGAAAEAWPGQWWVGHLGARSTAHDLQASAPAVEAHNPPNHHECRT